VSTSLQLLQLETRSLNWPGGFPKKKRMEASGFWLSTWTADLNQHKTLQGDILAVNFMEKLHTMPQSDFHGHSVNHRDLMVVVSSPGARELNAPGGDIRKCGKVPGLERHRNKPRLALRDISPHDHT
jgi:hypothetical protein